MSDLHALSMRELTDGLKNKQFSSVELTSHFLACIKTLDKTINSFMTPNKQAICKPKATPAPYILER